MGKKRNSLEERTEIDRLYVEYKPKLMQFVMATVENEDVAEDIVQDTFYEALRKYDVFKEHPHQIGWLYKAAGYKIKEYLRKMQLRNSVCMESDVIDEVLDYEGGYNEAESQMILYETLTQDELLRFRRYYIWGESTEEIAKKENITENNMRVRLTRLRQKIENALR